MEHYAGIDVSLESSSVCVVDATGRIVREAKVTSDPEVRPPHLAEHGRGRASSEAVSSL
jgi:transposase